MSWNMNAFVKVNKAWAELGENKGVVLNESTTSPNIFIYRQTIQQ